MTVNSSQPDDEPLDLLIRSDANIQNNTQISKRHSTIVRRMRLILPIIALGVIVILITWKSENASVVAVPREQVSPQTVSQNELIKPKFESEDSSGQPYSITADKATQNAGDMDTLHLQKPVADMILKSGDKVSLDAIGGEYKQQSKDLILDGQVNIRHNNGYTIQTDKMNIDVTNQTMTSESPVTGHGPSADLSATGMNVNGQSKIIIFNGPAKLTLHQANQDAPSDTPPQHKE